MDRMNENENQDTSPITYGEVSGLYAELEQSANYYGYNGDETLSDLGFHLVEGPTNWK